jgi:hypothetical protein
MKTTPIGVAEKVAEWKLRSFSLSFGFMLRRKDECCEHVLSGMGELMR